MKLFKKLYIKFIDWNNQRKFEQGLNELTQKKNYKKYVQVMMKKVDNPDYVDMVESNRAYRKYGPVSKKYYSWATKWKQIKITVSTWIFMIKNYSFTKYIYKRTSKNYNRTLRFSYNLKRGLSLDKRMAYRML